MNEFPETWPEPAQADAIAGEFLTETSTTMVVGRFRCTSRRSPEAIVFAGDGETVSEWGTFPEAADLPSTMVVGVHAWPTRRCGFTSILQSFNPERFAAHDKFFVGDVRHGWVAFRPRCPAHGGVWGFGGWRTCACSGDSASRVLRRGLLGLARWGIPAAASNAESVAAHVPRGRHASSPCLNPRFSGGAYNQTASLLTGENPGGMGGSDPC